MYDIWTFVLPSFYKIVSSFMDNNDTLNIDEKCKALNNNHAEVKFLSLMKLSSGWVINNW